MQRLNQGLNSVVVVVVIVFCAVLAVVTADYRDDALNRHNEYRRKHNAPPLRLSNQLNNVAQDWAQQLANSNEVKHRHGKYGENIFMSTDRKINDSTAVIQATDSWYNENSKYDYVHGVFSTSAGHFTQLVWKDSKYLGIGLARSSKAVYVVANYDPKGNIETLFLKNVLRPRNSGFLGLF